MHIMKTNWNFLLPVFILSLLVTYVHAGTEVSKWLQLDTGSNTRISQLIKSNVERRNVFLRDFIFLILVSAPCENDNLKINRLHL